MDCTMARLLRTQCGIAIPDPPENNGTSARRKDPFRNSGARELLLSRWHDILCRRVVDVMTTGLDRIVSIERPTIARDSFGGEIKTWLELAEVWANVRPITGQERFQQESNREQSLRRAKMRIRYRDDVYETYRVVYDSFTWDIEGIDELGFRRELELSLSADVSAAVVFEQTEFELAGRAFGAGFGRGFA